MLCQVYGKAMKDKVGQLAEDHKVLSKQMAVHRDEMAPIADAARAELALAAETAEHNRISQRKKCSLVASQDLVLMVSCAVFIICIFTKLHPSMYQ